MATTKAQVTGVLALAILFLFSVAPTATAVVGVNSSLVEDPVDPDGDGLSTVEELDLGTDPFEWDTDHDGVSDGDEVLVLYIDPLNPDSDSDGLDDGWELFTGSMTDPLNPDTDEDGLSDWSEVVRWMDPLHPDTDRDGVPDGEDEVRDECSNCDFVRNGEYEPRWHGDDPFSGSLYARFWLEEEVAGVGVYAGMQDPLVINWS